MKCPVVLSVWILFLEYATVAASERGDPCQDERGSYCRRIGQKQNLARCYARESRCCATCRRLRLDIPGCPYGDRASWCGSIGHDRPISDCYTHNATCCQTCRLYHSGNADCPYGDQLHWCSEIGSRYLVSSCYDKEGSCCDTCGRFRQPTPGCEYGDHENWCPWIDKRYCDTEPHVCCATCAVIASTSTSPSPSTSTTTATARTTSTTPGVTSSPRRPAISDVTATPEMVSSKRRPEVDGIATYTGSPGRPANGTAMTSRPVTANQMTVIHSGEHSTTTTNSYDLTNETAARDVICFNNKTHHKLRHSKHGGRHRPNGGATLDVIICKNATAASAVINNASYSNDKDLATLLNLTTSTNDTTGYNSTAGYNNNLPTASTRWTGVHGDKEYQEGHGIVFSLCPDNHSISRLNLSVGVLVLIIVIW